MSQDESSDKSESVTDINLGDDAQAQLRELVLDHLGIPRPGAGKYVQQLQDELLPAFLATARQAWLASLQPSLPNDPAQSQLYRDTEVQPSNIEKLSEILEALGALDVLRDVADSPNLASVTNLPMDPIDLRLLRASGQPDAEKALQAYLQSAAKASSPMAIPDQTLAKAAEASLKAHTYINQIYIVQPPATKGKAGGNDGQAAKPKKRRTLTGLGKLFSGLALLSGNGIVAVSVVVNPLAAIPVIGSLAAGIAAVGEGTGQLLREGE